MDTNQPVRQWRFCDNPSVAVIEGFNDLDGGGWYYFQACQEHLTEYEDNPHFRILPPEEESPEGQCGKPIKNV